jgi:hypothetical protein
VSEAYAWVSAQWAATLGCSSVMATREFHHCFVRSYTGRLSLESQPVRNALFFCFVQVTVSISELVWRDPNFAVIDQLRSLVSGSWLIRHLSKNFRELNNCVISATDRSAINIY